MSSTDIAPCIGDLKFDEPTAACVLLVFVRACMLSRAMVVGVQARSSLREGRS